MKSKINENIAISPLKILEFIKFNTGVKRFNVNSKEWYKNEKMTKSQMEVNIVVILQYFTGLRMNEIVKLSFSQLKDLAGGKKIRVNLSKSKTNKSRIIAISPKERNSKRLQKELFKIIKEWLKFKQDFLVVSSNMEPKKSIIKKNNGKEYETYYYPYINNFNTKVNRKLKDFVEYKESQKDEFLPNHIEKLTTHGFRNHFIVMLYNATNNDLSKTKTIIQHSDIKLTDRYITKFMENDLSIAIF